jgi:GT2 family glycosyltransferase
MPPLSADLIAPETVPHAPIHESLPRPRACGKFIFVGQEKMYIRGVTYGTFRPDENEVQFPEPEIVQQDFAQMAAQGFNAVRTYTVPPRWLLDSASRHGLYVMVGLPWEQHVAFLDGGQRRRSIEERVRDSVRVCAGHPAVLCYTVGNEIPAPIVRWYGRRRVEAFLERLYRVVKAEDPGSLVTYVNYPSTEYLELPFIDFVCFNVYLESEEKLRSYLARLQNIAGDRPLVMAEIGLDSRRNGAEEQARTLDWQIRTVFRGGAAGAFIFAWTDEWYRGGFDIEDWDFGLTRRDRSRKPALDAVRQAMDEVPFPANFEWPRISVVVCSYNGGRVIRDCLEGLLKIEYPNFEVIVVDDGSTDDTAEIVREYPFRLIQTENRGLSSARNTGMGEAKGEIVAYTDDDARPDPHWLTYLALTFETTGHAGVGGPNIAPPGDGPIADCIANAPGGPVPVLLSDTEAEHIPGCNCAYRKDALMSVGGWDPQFRTAGDDVDLCWRLQRQGYTIGFSPAAMVWHHRRNSLRMYWKQQQGYGKAEALLEAKWPDKYNAVGHVAWAGRLYGKGLTWMLGSWRSRIYQGTWGSAPFQSIYGPAPATLWSLPLMPEWYLITAALALLAALGISWSPLLASLPLLAMALAAPLAQAVCSAARASFTSEPASRSAELKLRAMTAFLHLLQPLARLRGRLRFGLTPWRRRGRLAWAAPFPRTTTLWSEKWRSPEDWLMSLCERLRACGAVVVNGGDFDRWDITARGGLLGGARVLTAAEEHGAGRQLLRFRVWPTFSLKAVALTLLLLFGAVGAADDGAWVAAILLAAAAIFLLSQLLAECALGVGTLLSECGKLESRARAQEAQAADAPSPAVERRAFAAAAGGGRNRASATQS